MQRPAHEYERLLASCRTFSGLPAEMLGELLDRMGERSYGKGEKLIRQDVRADALQVLVDGHAAVIVAAGSDDPTEVAEVHAGDVVGEMALISGERTSADVVARSEVRVLSLPADDFHELARRHPEIAVVLTRLIAERLGRADADALGGKLIHGHRILRCVGRGGMAVVYEAIRETDEQRVALKMMSHKLTYDSTALSRFREETALLDRLDHVNLASLLDRFSAYGTHFLVMEFCDGPGLDRVVAGKKPLPEALVRPITGQIARGLAYVHGLGFLHRDVKPSNVMLKSDGELRLIDFGVARPIRQVDDRTQTLETSVVGTPFYMAPEQFEETSDIDERVDSYALACVTFELLAGRRLFRKDTKFGIWKQKMALRLPPAEEIGDGISPEMDHFLRRNLDPDSEDRSTSLEEQAAWAAPLDFATLTAGL